MSNSQAHENLKKPREMPTIKIGATHAFALDEEEYQNPEHASVRKRELQKHLLVIIGANLTNLGITNLGLIVAAQNKTTFPANAPQEFGFYLLIMIIHFMLLSMVYYSILDHSRLIREIECIGEIFIIVVGFVVSSFLMIGFIEIHCATLVLLAGLIVIYHLFSPKKFPIIILVLVVAAALVLLFLGPKIFQSLFEVNKANAEEKHEVFEKLRM